MKNKIMFLLMLSASGQNLPGPMWSKPVDEEAKLVNVREEQARIALKQCETLKRVSNLDQLNPRQVCDKMQAIIYFEEGRNLGAIKLDEGEELACIALVDIDNEGQPSVLGIVGQGDKSTRFTYIPSSPKTSSTSAASSPTFAASNPTSSKK